MIDLIAGKVTLFTVQPHIGRTGRKRGLRELVAYETYGVIYGGLAMKIEILRVQHAAQQRSPRVESAYLFKLMA